MVRVEVKLYVVGVVVQPSVGASTDFEGEQTADSNLLVHYENSPIHSSLLDMSKI